VLNKKDAEICLDVPMILLFMKNHIALMCYELGEKHAISCNIV
jgi:hypothetical protein